MSGGNYRLELEAKQKYLSNFMSQEG